MGNVNAGSVVGRSLLLAVGLTLLAPGAARADEDNGPGGTVSCDFDLSHDTNPATVGAVIERDRMYMAERPGLQRKNLPLGFVFDANDMHLTSGGRYLFASEHQAREYLEWVREEFVLDNTHFFDRSTFVNPECHTFRLIGNADLGDVNTQQVVMRTERFRVPHSNQQHQLREAFTALVGEAQSRGLTGVRLAYNKHEELVELTYFANRVGQPLPFTPDFASLFALQHAPALGESLLALGYSRVFDRTQFVLTVWYPFVAGDHGTPAPFPNSPPLPAPYCGDGVCEVSRGESGTSCAVDCTPHCGDAICQADENESTQNCPGDCRLE
ncbi:MAG: hypothetical protein AB2A00_11620 [Myxococcota bacterium]